ncbi:Receptor-type guanylate cyclase gcy [Seminavis robusta]|uniref:Receptor-type guanylate cyclase gcy n=1 Tax=Seminavis robusta TaxID=568900 RepID=A0A9N8ENA4_9STRA|nr:Receptor-type guanylate cyclase gcy [Seminavis robusta]|eukprot:Sro1610_g285800.1 Receptor-type guanylate cyclase gcy (790) ;mRNA; f:7444-10073
MTSTQKLHSQFRTSPSSLESESFDQEEANASIESSLWSSNHGHNTTDEATETSDKINIAHSETRHVYRARIVMAVVLMLVAGIICGGVYYLTRKQEEEMFENAFLDLATKVADTFESMAARRLSAIESLAVTISSNAASRFQRWPNVTVDDFETRLSYTLDLAALVGIIFIPFITGETRKGWEEYSVQNQGWLKEGLSQQKLATNGDNYLEAESIEILEKTWGSSPNMTIPEEISKLSGTGIVEETGLGPYAPFWQLAPAIPVPNLVNYNALSHPSRTPKIKALIENKAALVSEAWDYSDVNYAGTVGKKAVLNLFLNRRQDAGLHYQDGPVSDLYVPIFEDVHSDVNQTANPSKVVGALTAYVYWQVYFYNILPKDTPEMTAILENTCGQAFTYKMMGKEVSYVGQGALFDSKYTDMAVTTGWNAFLQQETPTHQHEAQAAAHCSYQVRVYPTEDLENHYVTSDPVYSTLVLISAFVFTSLVFIGYDLAMERRNRVVMKKAVESTEVVNTLYPAAVRERLFDENKTQNPRSSLLSKSITKPELTSGPIHGDDGFNADIIADLYENVTVMFADLAGFTQWCDGREPKDVFLLLETLYGTFDTIARRRRVFKIETIGDCYLAVCGVPKANDKHAVVMTRFAWECIAKMDSLIELQLAETMGDETKDLKLRVGLHSGSLTAGVVRGDRARFQIFGDTVNTASRIESNGLPGNIQASETTASLLIEAGKSEWVREREGGIDAKGKGNLRAFWVKPKSVIFQSSSTVESSSVAAGSSSESDSRTSPCCTLVEV